MHSTKYEEKKKSSGVEKALVCFDKEIEMG